MHQQVNSYAFQLSQNLEKSVLECHISQPLFYAAGMSHSKGNRGKKSLLYRLDFDEQNPRKSQLKKHQIGGSVQGIYSIFKDSQDFLLIIKGLDGNYSLQKTSFPLLEEQTIKLEQLESFKQTKYSLLNHKQTKRQFLVGENQIYGLNEETLKRGEKFVEVQEQKKITASILDPIHELLTYVLEGRQIIVTDKTFKKQKYALKIGTQDLSTIASIDYNPNKQYYLISCHNEALKFWDIRKPNFPVKVFTDHHTLVLNAKYNPSHDELISCSYDDGTVGLLRMNSVSSTPGENQDVMVKLYDEHEDSVFNLKWGAFSPWIFTSLSYSAANIVVNFVPSVEKYRILL